MRRDVELYARGEALVVAPIHEDRVSQFVGGPVERLALPVRPAALGEALARAFARTMDYGRAERPGDDDRDLLEAFGVRTWSQMVEGTSAVAVRQTEPAYSILPLRNLGRRHGFDFLVELRRELPAAAPLDRLGATVLEAFAYAQPPLAGRATGPVREEREAPPSPAEALDLAARAAEALRRDGYGADHTLDSLAELDRFFDAELERPARPRRGGALAEDTGAKLLGIAGYVGETLRLALGARWHEAGGGEDPEMLLADGSVIWPLRRVLARYEEGPEASLSAYGRGLASRTGPAG